MVIEIVIILALKIQWVILAWVILALKIQQKNYTVAGSEHIRT
jgi:hypothetical protein